MRCHSVGCGTAAPAASRCRSIPAESNLPENIDWRAFLIRNAVIGAAMTGTVWTTEALAQQAAKEAAAKPSVASARFHLDVATLGRREKVQGSSDDCARGIL